MFCSESHSALVLRGRTVTGWKCRRMTSRVNEVSRRAPISGVWSWRRRCAGERRSHYTRWCSNAPDPTETEPADKHTIVQKLNIKNIWEQWRILPEKSTTLDIHQWSCWNTDPETTDRDPETPRREGASHSWSCERPARHTSAFKHAERAKNTPQDQSLTHHQFIGDFSRDETKSQNIKTRMFLEELHGRFLINHHGQNDDGADVQDGR